MDEQKGCEKVLNRVSAIIDGETSAFDRLRFKAHLAVCPSCKRYVNQFKAVKEASGVVTEEDLPSDFDEVMSFVLDHIEPQRQEG